MQVVAATLCSVLDRSEVKSMGARMTFEAENRADLEEIREAIDKLLAGVGGATTAVDDGNGATTTPGHAGGLAAAKVQALWDRNISPHSWNLLHTIADRDPDSEVTFLDLHKELGISDGKIKAWHRNLVSAVKPIHAKFGKEPKFLVSRWDGTRQHYRVPAEVRQAVLALGRK
jgi:hypothetical protein